MLGKFGAAASLIALAACAKSVPAPEPQPAGSSPAAPVVLHEEPGPVVVPHHQVIVHRPAHHKPVVHNRTPAPEPVPAPAPTAQPAKKRSLHDKVHDWWDAHKPHHQ